MSNTIIIGAGISGLSTAYYLEKSKKNGMITILEASSSAGGKVATVIENGFIVETAPDSFITTKPHLLELIKELGLTREIINPSNSKFYILKDGKLNDVPEGLSFMVPLNKEAFMRSELFSHEGKIRAMEEENIPVKILDSDEDESFGEFVERRFGIEMLKNYAEPLFGGIYSTPSFELSMKAAFPQFYSMVEKHGSMTKAILERMENASDTSGKEEKQRSPFVSLKYGMQSLIDKLLSSLKETKIITDTKVDSITRHGDIYTVTAGERSWDANSIIIALPSNIAAELIKDLDTELSDELNGFSSNSSRILTLAYKKGDCELPDATGFVITQGEETSLSASTWSSKKWPGRAPETHHLIRCFFSKPELMRLSKDELIIIAQEELSRLVHINGEPTHSWLHSYPNLLPQYKVGHLQKLKRVESLLEKHKGLDIIGAFSGGVGLPDRVRQGSEIVS